MCAETETCTQFTEQIKAVANALVDSQRILFITGAGISADSGLPTYRGIGGLYNDTVTEEGISIETALAGRMLKDRPEVTWKYLAQIEKRCRTARYNTAHRIISGMQDHFTKVWVLTQNIDGFHHDAGSRDVIDIHGNMRRLLCPACGWRTELEDYSGLSIPPFCPDCNAVARPDVVFFGEFLPQDKLAVLQHEVDKGFDIYFSIGTTSVFPYIQQPILDAKRRNKFTVEINPSETNISHIFDVRLPLGASVAMKEIWKEYLVKVENGKKDKKLISSSARNPREYKVKRK